MNFHLPRWKTPNKPRKTSYPGLPLKELFQINAKLFKPMCNTFYYLKKTTYYTKEHYLLTKEHFLCPGNTSYHIIKLVTNHINTLNNPHNILKNLAWQLLPPQKNYTTKETLLKIKHGFHKPFVVCQHSLKLV